MANLKICTSLLVFLCKINLTRKRDWRTAGILRFGLLSGLIEIKMRKGEGKRVEREQECSLAHGSNKRNRTAEWVGRLITLFISSVGATTRDYVRTADLAHAIAISSTRGIVGCYNSTHGASKSLFGITMNGRVS